MARTKTTFAPGHQYHPPRKTGFTKEELASFMSDKWPDMVECFDTLQPIQRWQIYLKLIEYRLPKLQAVQLSDETTQSKAIDMLRQLYGKDKQDNQNE